MAYSCGQGLDLEIGGDFEMMKDKFLRIHPQLVVVGDYVYPTLLINKLIVSYRCWSYRCCIAVLPVLPSCPKFGIARIRLPDLFAPLLFVLAFESFSLPTIIFPGIMLKTSVT